MNGRSRQVVFPRSCQRELPEIFFLRIPPKRSHTVRFSAVAEVLEVEAALSRGFTSADNSELRTHRLAQRAASRSIAQHRAASRSIAQHRAASRSIAQHRAASRSIAQHRAASRSIAQHRAATWFTTGFTTGTGSEVR